MNDINLCNSTSFLDLYARSGLERIDRAFMAVLEQTDTGAFNRLVAARAMPDSVDDAAESALILELAPHLDAFIAELFNIRTAVIERKADHDALAPLYQAKRLFVQRVAVKKIKAEEAVAFDGPSLRQSLTALMGQEYSDGVYARTVLRWLDEKNEAALDVAARFAAWAVATHAFPDSVVFKVPHKLDFERLVPVETVVRDGVTMLRLPSARHRQRYGFSLTDRGFTLEQGLDEATYCIWCHHQGKDSCSKGLKDKKTGAFQASPFGVPLAGCPLEEKISQMHEAKAAGHFIGALGIVVIDNPMCAGTGHRICNDCMKACIYQKQEPVNIPLSESQVLADVLNLPYGFEIYSLLTRWNPLNIRRPLPRPDTGKNVLVVGLGPAGYTLAHHLLNDGHSVVAVDGLKIEPLPQEISGVDTSGARIPFHPVADVRTLYEDLDKRTLAGFGGVAEYGITVRWNKNYLKLLRLLLERRSSFTMVGGVRLGGTFTLEQAFSMGFDHIALCMGAGRPTIIPMENGLAKGVRQASDFLMALQLQGAGKEDSLANLQVRLPVVVIGGGLTAIDTATEALAYYAVQVEKFLKRYETLTQQIGEDQVRRDWNAEETSISEEMLTHGRALRQERLKQNPDVIGLLQSWGGATLAYRRRLQDAPSYTLNHEEVHLGMEEGIHFSENLTPRRVDVDSFGAAAALVCTDKDGQERRLAARTILVAAGTQPNTVLAREDGSLQLDGKYFQAIDSSGAPVKPEKSAKPAQAQVLMHKTSNNQYVSFFGDLHPSFAGNVVKAMGSAKQGYPVVSQVLADQPGHGINPTQLAAVVNRDWRARVRLVQRLTPTIVEVVAEAPAAARNFQPGQFYRLQNFESNAQKRQGTILAMEGLALTGAWVDKEQGLLSTIVLEMGGSSDLCARLKPGEPIVLMGPTGAPTEIPHGQTVLLAGGGLGNAVLFSIGAALKAAGSTVLYFAGYKKIADRYKIEQIEAAADVVVWCCDEAPGFVASPHRPQDKTFTGNIVQAMQAYHTGALGPVTIPLPGVEHLIAIGSDRMMRGVALARHSVLKDAFNPCHHAVGSINSPMQCMMKEICAQCLQRHVDPVTDQETVVFSCFNQDQNLDTVDFANLNDRLGQNAAQEKLTKQWLQWVLEKALPAA